MSAIPKKPAAASARAGSVMSSLLKETVKLHNAPKQERIAVQSAQGSYQMEVRVLKPSSK